ncbi:MAG: alpha-galactosidase [Gammaproteobacteria bacterium]|nr:alpha-galactosidase [Gammaproteobacteria bacterium]
MIQTWRLDHGQQSMVLAASEQGMATVIYWGKHLPVDTCLATLAAAQQRDVTGGMIDVLEPVSLCPVEGNAYAGQPALLATNEQGQALMPRFVLASVEHDQASLMLTYTDQQLGLRYVAHIRACATLDVWRLSACLDAQQPIQLHWLAAPVLPAADYMSRIQEYGGRWVGEFQQHESTWGPSALVRENRTGRSGHEHFPALLVSTDKTSHVEGEVYAWHYGWSGGHKMIAEQLPDGRRQVQFGHVCGSQRGLQQHFQTADLYVAYSAQGINGISVAMQKLVRNELLPSDFASQPRPVHYNCWEAIYFDHSLEKLCALAKQASALGAERFVLDDGWFGKRNDDTSSLGDWYVDTEKYADGLQPLIDEVQAQGMSFGLWFEPEMVNENSQLFGAHPDWVLGYAEQTRGRQQLILNMALPEVQTYLYDRISDLLSTYDITYIKWDHNRVLPHADAAQTMALYALLSRLRKAFAHVEIESCASGGGRIDFGILQHTQRVWLSDSNDALERLRIQNQSATFLPLLVAGSHVGPRHCHTSGRVHSMAFRAWVAAQRHMGMEMDPSELTDEESQQLKTVISWWKSNRMWLQKADILRLDTADQAILAEQQLAADGAQFVVFVGLVDTSQQIVPRPLRLTALDAHSNYQINLLNKYELVGNSRGITALKQQSLILSGAYLMSYGITLPWQFPNAMWVVEGTKQ